MFEKCIITSHPLMMFISTWSRRSDCEDIRLPMNRWKSFLRPEFSFKLTSNCGILAKFFAENRKSTFQSCNLDSDQPYGKLEYLHSVSFVETLDSELAKAKTMALLSDSLDFLMKLS